jgi:hypothetical protein
MAGLVPAIQSGDKSVDARHKAGHDESNGKPRPRGVHFAAAVCHVVKD